MAIRHAAFALDALHLIYRVFQEERSIFWELIISVILNTNVYMNMCPIPNGFRYRTV